MGVAVEQAGEAGEAGEMTGRHAYLLSLGTCWGHQIVNVGWGTPLGDGIGLQASVRQGLALSYGSV